MTKFIIKKTLQQFRCAFKIGNPDLQFLADIHERILANPCEEDARELEQEFLGQIIGLTFREAADQQEERLKKDKYAPRLLTRGGRLVTRWT